MSVEYMRLNTRKRVSMDARWPLFSRLLSGLTLNLLRVRAIASSANEHFHRLIPPWQTSTS